MTEQEKLDLMHFSYGGPIHLWKIPKIIQHLAELKLYVIVNVRKIPWAK